MKNEYPQPFPVTQVNGVLSNFPLIKEPTPTNEAAILLGCLNVTTAKPWGRPLYNVQMSSVTEIYSISSIGVSYSYYLKGWIIVY